MVQFFRFIQIYETWIYLLLGGISVFFIQKTIRSWLEWRAAIFGLEKESAQRKLSASIAIVGLLFFFAAIEFFLVSFVLPTKSISTLLITSTIDVITISSDTNPGINSNVREELLVTISPSGATLGCTPGEIEWNSPIQGDQISGMVELMATINIPDLGYYKYEYVPSGNETWTTLAGGNSSKNNELIGTWNTELMMPGDYRLRLVVFNSQNQELPPCELSLQVLPP